MEDRPTAQPTSEHSPYTCEVAFVSHHSETPDAMHDRLMREAGPDDTLHRICNDLRPRVEQAVRDGADTSILGALRTAATERARAALGRDPDDRLHTLLFRHYALPMADRIIRHQTLRWAAQICNDRGWRLHIHGRGWDKHPTLAPHARGELEHGDALRQAYRSAACHLHASIHTAVHQRVMECALSGGLPLCRLTRDDVSAAIGWSRRAACARSAPTICDAATRWQGFIPAEHPETMSVAAQLQRLGLDPTEAHMLPQHRLESTLAGEPTSDPLDNPAWLLGDLSETTFRSRDELEARLASAVQRPARRRSLSEGIAARVRARLTHDAFVRRAVTLVRDSLAGQARDITR